MGKKRPQAGKRSWMERYGDYERACMEADKLPNGPERTNAFAKCEAEYKALMAEPDAPKLEEVDPLESAILSVRLMLNAGAALKESEARDILWREWLENAKAGRLGEIEPTDCMALREQAEVMVRLMKKKKRVEMEALMGELDARVNQENAEKAKREQEQAAIEEAFNAKLEESRQWREAWKIETYHLDWIDRFIRLGQLLKSFGVLDLLVINSENSFHKNFARNLLVAGGSGDREALKVFQEKLQTSSDETSRIYNELWAIEVWLAPLALTLPPCELCSEQVRPSDYERSYDGKCFVCGSCRYHPDELKDDSPEEEPKNAIEAILSPIRQAIRDIQFFSRPRHYVELEFRRNLVKLIKTLEAGCAQLPNVVTVDLSRRTNEAAGKVRIYRVSQNEHYHAGCEELALIDNELLAAENSLNEPAIVVKNAGEQGANTLAPSAISSTSENHTVEVNMKDGIIIVDGERFDVEPHHALWINALIEARLEHDPWVVQKTLNALPGCSGKNADREWKRLFATVSPLQALVESGQDGKRLKLSKHV